MGKDIKIAPTSIGPSFASELTAQGLGDGISWTSTRVYYDNTISNVDSKLDTILAAHNPLTPAPLDEDTLAKQQLVDDATAIRAKAHKDRTEAEINRLLDDLLDLNVEAL
jgi:hypothetical protein